MDPKSIKSIWAAWMEVQEAKHKKKEGLDPVGKEDDDVDNDGDADSSDEYLKNRRKKIGKAMKDDDKEQKEGKIPPQFLKGKDKDKKKDDEDSDEKEESYGKKMKKEGTLPPALQKAIDKKKGKKTDDKDDEESDDKDDVKESEESPYPSLDKKKREKKGSNLEPAGGPADKLKGEAVESKVECPKCKGEGCDHCDDKGYHMKKESINYDIFSLAELEALAEKMEQPNDGAGAGEPFMSTNSAGEKKFYDDHKKSDKKFEDMEAQGEMDAVKAGQGVKSQSPTRRGEKRQSEPMSKVQGK